VNDPAVHALLSPLLRLWGGYDEAPDEERIGGRNRDMEMLGRAVESLHRGGVRLATGTDTPALPGAIHVELEELVAAGLTPMEALMAATSNAARVLGAEGEIGTIEVGRWADLILLDADPLEDIRNTRRIWKVIHGGRVVDREALLEWAREQH